MHALARLDTTSGLLARMLASTRRHTQLLLLASLSILVCPAPAHSADSGTMERAMVDLMSDPQLFTLTPESAARKLAPFGRLQEDKAGGFTAGGTAVLTFFIELTPYGRRAGVYFDRSNKRLTNLTLMFSPEDEIDAARVRAALTRSLGAAKEWSSEGSNRVVWWDGADGRRIQLMLDPPGVEPAQLYMASVGREASNRR